MYTSNYFFVCSDLHCNVVKSRLGGATMQFVCAALSFCCCFLGGARVLILLCMVVCWWFVLQRRAVRQAVSCASPGHGVRFTGRRLCVRFAICFDIFVFMWVICKTTGAFFNKMKKLVETYCSSLGKLIRFTNIRYRTPLSSTW